MNLGAYSHEQLLQLIIASAIGAVILAVVFVVVLMAAIRKNRLKNTSEKPHLTETSSLLIEKEKVRPMPLLKSYGKKNTSSETTSVEGRPNPQPPVELMRVLMDPTTRKIMLEVDGVRYEDLKTVPDRTIGQRILETAAAVLAFTRGIIVTASGTKSLPVPDVSISHIPTATVSDTPPAEPTLSQETLAARQQFLADLESRAHTASVPNPTALSRWGRRRKKQTAEEAEVSTGLFNLAEQIDEILQKKWAASGLAEEVKIHSVPGGGMRIQVGAQFYDSVDTVENLDARALIQSAIKTWESR